MTTLKTFPLFSKSITITIRDRERKPHQWNMRAVGKSIREAREQMHQWLWEQVND